MDWIRPGQTVRVRLDAYPERDFSGRTGFIYPTVAAETRTVKDRIEMPNPEGLLWPGLYGSITLSAAVRPQARLAVPGSAVLDSGTRKGVLVKKGEGRFEPPEVRLGRFADGYYEVLAGASTGETMVTRANSLIDAESRLKSALDGFGMAEPVEENHQHHGGSSQAP